MQPHSEPSSGGTHASSPHTHHQYAIEGYAAPNLVQSNVTASSDLLNGTAPPKSQSTQQHSAESLSTPVNSPSKQNGSSKVFSNSPPLGKKGGDIGSDSKQQSSQPISTFTPETRIFSALGDNDIGTLERGHEYSSQETSTFTSVRHVFPALSLPTLFESTHKNQNSQQMVPSEQQRHSELDSNFTMAKLASQYNMDPASRSPFPPEVQTFTQSYQFSPILPTFSRIPPQSSPSIASQVPVDHQLQSASVGMVQRHSSSHVTGMEVIGISSQTETSLGTPEYLHVTEKEVVGFSSQTETSLSVPEPLYGLGITFTPQTSAPSTASQTLEHLHGLGITFGPLTSTPSTASQTHNHHNTSQLLIPPTSENGRGEGELSDNTRFRQQGFSPFTIAQSTNEFISSQQEKVHQSIGRARLASGFTPLVEQGKGSRATDDRLAKKIRLSDKENLTPSAPRLTTTATFGPTLHTSKIQNQRSSVPNSNNDQARSSSFSQQASTKNQKLVFNAVDKQHLEFLLKEMEQLTPAMLNQVEIRMLDSPSSSAKFNLPELALLKRVQRQRLITFSKEYYQSMALKQRMTPEVRSMVKFVSISQLGLARPTIKLKVLPPPLTEFHLFTKLPTELQHRIWKFCLPGPRTVCLTAPKNRPGLEIFQPKQRPPIILQVCAQSRAVAKRTLQPAFENRTILPGARTYFDFEIDSLRLTSSVSIETAKAIACTTNPSIVRDRQRVRHLEIPFHIGHNLRQYKSLAALILLAPQRGWPAIKTLTFPGCPGNCRNDSEDTYRMPVIEVVKKSATVGGLVQHITGEFRDVWEDVKDKMEVMPDCGLKVVYLEKDEDLE